MVVGLDTLRRIGASLEDIVITRGSIDRRWHNVARASLLAADLLRSELSSLDLISLADLTAAVLTFQLHLHLLFLALADAHKALKLLDHLVFLIELAGELLDLGLLGSDLLIGLSCDLSCLLVPIDACLELHVDLFFLFQLFLGDRCQIGELADLDLVRHVLSVALGEHAHSIQELVVDGDFVFESASVAVVKNVNFFSLVLKVDFEVHRAIDSRLDALLLLRDLLDLFLFVLELAVEDRDSSLELLQLSLIEDNLGLRAHLVQFLLPLGRDLCDLALKLALPAFSLLDVERRHGRVESLSVLLGLHNQVSLQVHEPVEALVLLDLQDEHISRLLCLTELNGKFAGVVASLDTELVKLALFLLERTSQIT
mmetsp:Transcript_24950/g.31111  ORF Transcript_24950/g.31111 Transcript_24950/m.31111 type:complete len:370 (-) Transcript_24950:873-1982(-)